jgi:hypothetical protein
VAGITAFAQGPTLDKEDVEGLEDAPDAELEATEEQILDQATAARSIGELRIEIDTLKRLEALALSIRRSGEDKKWSELATLLGEIFTPAAILNELADEQLPYDAGAPELPPKPKLQRDEEQQCRLYGVNDDVTEKG